ncbi:hypothetical protein [Rhodococcus pyridinivorans]|uniref:hypothetical protein n=1 Tax=Rhodococcus pyridinivorans TaxID=103816 RepID=UPI00158676D8|nr:hypothetical protein [Rhodococcus pyridinivorans]
MTLDRTGEPVDDTDEADLRLVVSHDPRCRRGWLGEDPDGHPIPCLTCRPHLRRQEP